MDDRNKSRPRAIPTTGLRSGLVAYRDDVPGAVFEVVEWGSGHDGLCRSLRLRPTRQPPHNPGSRKPFKPVKTGWVPVSCVRLRFNEEEPIEAEIESEPVNEVPDEDAY